MSENNREKLNGSETFIELCVQGRASLDEVDDFIERWHDKGGDTSLHDFLGLSDIEYSLWINDPDVLPYVLLSRKELRPFIQVVDETYYCRLAKGTENSGKLQLVRDWLHHHGHVAH